MNDLKMIASLMKMATETVLHSKYKEEKNIENFSCRVGTGSATNVTSSYINRLRQTGIQQVLTYGLKMLQSKQTKKQAMVWTTGKEITSRGYFNGNPSFKNLIVSVMLHEYAHVIQNQEEGLNKTNKRREIHGDFFYSILDGFYEKGHHIELDKYLSAFPAYQNAEFLNEDKAFTKEDLIGAEYCRINSEKFKNILLKIDKLNPKTIVATQENGVGFKAYYTSIDKVYMTKSDLPDGVGTFSRPTLKKTNPPKKSTLPKTKLNPVEKTTYSAFELRKSGAKYISILNKGNVETFKVEKLNPKRVAVVDIKSADRYTVPYEIIKEVYSELPSHLSENEELIKSKEIERLKNRNKETKYNNRNLKKDQIIETKIKGVLRKFKILKLNPSRLKGEMVGSSSVIYNIPYGNILKAY